jgi:2,4-dienoyl-CoA reductase-like NADH-dependent reductase (Old Yellow Enzyme family)/thioredoxin reductase
MVRPMLEPFGQAPFALRSRVVLPPMLDRLGSPDGHVTEQLCRFYAERAEGGVGLAIIGGMAVSELAKYRPGGLHIYDDIYLPGLRRLTEALHRAGAKAGVQLQHAGRMVADPPQPGNRTLGPSSLTDALTGKPVEGITVAEIGDVVRSFTDAAARARAAGFDHVEVHASHGYLPSAFLSPFTNRRNDDYGGDTARRARLTCEIVAAIRRDVGDTMTIGVRINGTDFVDGGSTLEDSIAQCRLIAAQGVDLFHVSAGTPDAFDQEFPLGYEEPGCYRHLARAIREATGLPVITVGRINTPATADEIIASGDADLVAIGRALIADPAFVRKAAAGAENAIRPCIACNVCVDKEPGPFPPTPCSVNALAGREALVEIAPAREARRVLVVGAGPAGLEAARVAAQRGHEVVVIDRAAQAGGQMAIAATLHHKTDFGRWLRYALSAAEEAGASFRFGTPLDREQIERFRPDAAFLATGAVPAALDVPGAELPHVLQAVDVLRDAPVLGREILVVGATRIGLITAEHLAREGHRVTVLEPGADVAAEMGYTFKKGVFRRLAAHGATIMPRSRVLRIRAGRVQVSHDGILSPTRSEIVDRPADHVILALERRPNRAGASLLEDTGIPWTGIGDCLEPRRIINAVHEGARAAMAL